MNWKRFPYLARLIRPSAWRFLALTATDPRMDYLYETQRSLGTKDWLTSPKPWFTEQAFELLQTMIKPGMNVLEWGSGSSTLWLAQLGCQVTAIEHDKNWYDDIHKHIPAPSKIMHVAIDRNYTEPVESLSNFDVIVIDGRRRHDCATAVANAAETGLLRSPCFVVFDDSERPAYRESRDRLDRAAFQHFPCTGATGIPLDKLTSVFEFRRDPD